MINFPSLLGNDRLKSVFASIEPQKIGSAVILEGCQGSGKLTAALDLAAALLCTSSDKPCGICNSCRRIKAGSNSDLEILTNPDGKTPNVDDVRAMRSRSFVRSGSSGIKVFIIPHADKLNDQSQNALLKVLEEPINTVFILTCTNYMDLLQTVRSRCTVYHLEPLPECIISGELSKIEGYTAEQCDSACKICNGSLGVALNLLKNGQSGAYKAAVAFSDALGDELALFKASNLAASLSREEYLSFCSILCDRISSLAKTKDDSTQLIAVYEYIQKQTDLMANNPSISALSGALAAFCGNLYS